MVHIIRSSNSPDASKLTRWLGEERVQDISRDMKGWYGPPIAVSGVPGQVWAHGDGDFSGYILNGWEATAMDYANDMGNRMRRAWRRATNMEKAVQLNAGFASLSDLISEASTGKRQECFFQKAGPAPLAIGGCTDLWLMGAQPAAGVLPSAATGTAVTVANTGAQPFSNAASGDTLHFIGAGVSANLAGSSLLLYDRLTHYLKVASTTGPDTGTATVTRYANTTVATAADYAGGNFIFMSQGTTLASLAHTWTGTYTNQAGATAKTIPTVTGLATGTAGRLDMNNPSQWFAPLATGDTGVTLISAMTCSVATITGSAVFAVGRPLAWMGCPVANMVCQIDGINTAFNLVRIFDGAALSFLEIAKSATTATAYTGSFTLVSG